jgi:hypothetical protein
MFDMRRTFLLAAAVCALVASTGVATAAASVIELGGQTKTPVKAPACPPNTSPVKCTIILTRVTALETLRDGISYPTKVTKAGKIVAFSVGLSSLSSNANTRRSFIKNLDATYGGTTQVGITVLQPVGRRTQWKWQVVASSPVYHVQPYMGSVAQFALNTSIEVKPGQVIALTTPTWAPVLSIQQVGKQFAYRQSRSANCDAPPNTNQAQTGHQTGTYTCNYPGTRPEYSATEITDPPTTNPVH